jgi:hypothetical protein
MPWFRSQHPATTAGAPAVVVDRHAAKAELRDAYDKGRIDERKRHRSSPMLTVFLLLIAVMGAVLLYYAFREGSFAGGGAVVDNKISQVTSQAAPAAQNAAATAGALAEKAGDKLKAQGQAVQQDTAPKDGAPDAPPASSQ